MHQVKVSIAIPSNEYTSVYVVKVTRGKNSKYYGYISHYNTNNYFNLGFGMEWFQISDINLLII